MDYMKNFTDTVAIQDLPFKEAKMTIKGVNGKYMVVSFIFTPEDHYSLDMRLGRLHGGLKKIIKKIQKPRNPANFDIKSFEVGQVFNISIGAKGLEFVRKLRPRLIVQSSMQYNTSEVSTELTQKGLQRTQDSLRAVSPDGKQPTIN